MHCSDEALLQTHSEETRAHLATCSDCQARLAVLQKLRADAQALPLMQPKAMAWDKVKQNLPKAPIKTSTPLAVEPVDTVVIEAPKAANESLFKRFKMHMLVAASFAVGVLVTQISHQMDDLNQLETQIALSKQYESQLVALRMTSPFIEGQLWQISEIDKQLNQQLSAKERHQLWLKRNEVLLQMLTTPTHSNEMI